VDFYTALILYLSGTASGFTLACLLTYVALKRGWIRVKENSR
jgi:hypothetical protein